MTSIISPQTVAPISKMGDRNEVLKHLLPKIFGIFCEEGQSIEELPGCSVRLDGELILIGSHLDPDRIVLSAHGTVKSRLTKVLSLHVTDLPSSGDPSFYRLYNGCVGVLSWRRGEWEDAVMAHGSRPLSLSETFLRGVFRTENQILH